MNRFLIPLLILLGSLLYSWFWNCSDTRRPTCNPVGVIVEDVPAPAADPIPETPPLLTEKEQEELLFNPLDIYFESGQSGISRNAEINAFLETAKAYLDAHPDKQLTLTGHSDSDGPEDLNQNLSEGRAARVKEILLAEGFKAEQLETSGKGELEPIVPNDSPENKAKNRRVSIRLKN